MRYLNVHHGAKAYSEVGCGYKYRPVDIEGIGLGYKHAEHAAPEWEGMDKRNETVLPKPVDLLLFLTGLFFMFFKIILFILVLGLVNLNFGLRTFLAILLLRSHVL